MSQRVVTEFPPIEAAYTEEFGNVDPDVYRAAKQIWTHAEDFAARLLHDSHKGMQLMLKAVAKVSSVRAKQPETIKNLPSYLYQSYKHLVLAECRKENAHKEKLNGWLRENENISDVDEEVKINKKILINELRLKMDDWTREVFDLLEFGYTYEELVPKFGSAANVIRSKFSKKTAQLAREIKAKIDSTDEQIKRLK